MTANRVIAGLIVSIVLLIGAYSAGAAEKADRVNAFYSRFVDTLKAVDAGPEKIATLVVRARTTAMECLDVMKNKLAKEEAANESLQYLHDELEAMLLLTATGQDCSEDWIRTVEKRAQERADPDYTMFCLTNVIRRCPNQGEKLCFKLGDLYLQERRFGMAVDAYTRGLQQRDDEDSRKLLERARQLLAQYEKGAAITKEEVARILQSSGMAPVPGSFNRKVQMRNRIQTNKVLFDEWKAVIRPEFLPELNALGEALRDAFLRDTKTRLVIEGHTDNRGDLNRNEILSRERAEAIKKYLVDKFGLDPSRLVTHGYGPSRPVSPRNDKVGWALNRRVEFGKE